MNEAGSKELIFPRECEPEIYRSLHADLAEMADDELWQHWLRFGCREGRAGNALRTREDFAALALLVAPAEDVLEIGPFVRPLLRGVRYCDVLTTEELRARAATLGEDPIRVPAVDFTVDLDLGLAAHGRRYAAVMSSHVVEHQPDLIRHLLDVSESLKPGGRYFLLIPDCRYCFDHFLAPSRVSDVVLAHVEHHTRHTLRSVIEHRVFTTHNEARRHWAADHGDRLVDFRERLVSALREYHQSQENNVYVDVHAWQFTPESFCGTVEASAVMFDVPLIVERLYPTRRNSLEFWAILRRKLD